MALHFQHVNFNVSILLYTFKILTVTNQGSAHEQKTRERHQLNPTPDRIIKTPRPKGLSSSKQSIITNQLTNSPNVILSMAERTTKTPENQ